KRTDIWAFGCVLYEMLTARRAFGGDEVAGTLAKVLESQPDWRALGAAVPPRVRDVLRRCLEKDPRHRLRDIGDALPELQDAATASMEDHATTLGAKPMGWWRIAAAGFTMLTIGVAVGGIGAWNVWMRDDRAVLRFDITAPGIDTAIGTDFSF